MTFSWQMAEELAAAHMRALGFSDARRTNDGADGGLDVVSSAAVAQVKFQAAPVGSPKIQQLRGAGHRVDNALFYASAGYSSAALSIAATLDVALFSFDTDNNVWAVNERASELAATGWRTASWADAVKVRLVDLRRRESAWTRTIQAALGRVISELQELMASAIGGGPLDSDRISLYQRGMEFQRELPSSLNEQQRLIDRFSQAVQSLEEHMTDQRLESFFAAGEECIAGCKRFAGQIEEVTGEDLSQDYERRYLDLADADAEQEQLAS